MKKRRFAFTIVELLTVIAILTLLIGILIPTLSASRRQAKASACLSRLKQLGTAFAVYLTENRDQFPPAKLKHVPPDNLEVYVNQYMTKEPRWHWFLELGLGPVIDPGPFKRLGRPWGDDGLYEGRANVLDRKGTTMTIDAFLCPALDDPEYERDIRNGAFGYNYQYLGNSRQDTDPKRWDNFSVPLHQVKTPGETVLIADSRGGHRVHGVHSYTMDPPRMAKEKNAQRFGPTADDLPQNVDPALFAFSPVEMRHNKQGNVIFADVHGENMTHTELGYEVNEQGIPVPITDPAQGSTWNNRLWTGLGRDLEAEKLRR